MSSSCYSVLQNFKLFLQFFLLIYTMHCDHVYLLTTPSWSPSHSTDRSFLLCSSFFDLHPSFLFFFLVKVLCRWTWQPCVYNNHIPCRNHVPQYSSMSSICLSSASSSPSSTSNLRGSEITVPSGPKQSTYTYFQCFDQSLL